LDKASNLYAFSYYLYMRSYTTLQKALQPLHHRHTL